MVSVNASLQIDLTGQVCAESIGLPALRHRGATDFAWGAYHARGGQAILAQTATTKQGTLSRIVPTLDPGAIVSVSRNLTDLVVTEYGVAKLRQRTVRQRVENLIAVAHPDFRAERGGRPTSCCISDVHRPGGKTYLKGNSSHPA